jgi:Zn finger protein HypA/HybF involved in hydrogenase expression
MSDGKETQGDTMQTMIERAAIDTQRDIDNEVVEVVGDGKCMWCSGDCHAEDAVYHTDGFDFICPECRIHGATLRNEPLDPSAD